MNLSTIWVVTPFGDDLVSGARSLAGTVNAVTCSQAGIPGADLSLVLPELGEHDMIEGYAKGIADQLKARGAEVVLFNADARSRLLAGLIATYLGTSAFTASGMQSEDGKLIIERTVYGGLATATLEVLTPTAVLVVPPGSLPIDQAQSGAGIVERLDLVPEETGLRVVANHPKQVQTVSLATASRVVGVGRGFAAEADLDLARKLAEKLDAELACSRPIAEGVNWLPTERYVGVTGATIAPDLYLAIGISGQIQHMVGVTKAKTIIAINKDKNAPIFAKADIGVVGDLYAVVPALIDALG